MRRLLLSMTLILSASHVFGQIEFGLKAGVSTLDLTDSELSITTPSAEALKLSIADANYGFHFGLYSRIKLLNIYIEPAVLFNSSQINYTLQEGIFDESVVTTTKTEKFEKLDIPVLVGIKMGFLRLQAGPVARLHINSISDLTDIDGYSQRFKSATYGFQLGAGLDILNVRLDVNYEGNLSKVGDHIVIDGESYTFGESPSRLVASIGYRF